MSAFLLCQKLLALALFLQSIEMLKVRKRIANIWLDGRLHGLTLLFSAQAATAVLASVDARAFPLALVLQLFLVVRLRGPFAGASDAMTLQALISITGSVLVPELKRAFMAYLAVQVTLSLFLSGIHKARHRQWWNGVAMARVLGRETQSVPLHFRAAGLIVLAFELAFPLAMFSPTVRLPLVVGALGFHCINAYALGLNRFFWAWLAAYPALWALS